MMGTNLLTALHVSWQACTKPVFTTFDPDFQAGRHVWQLLDGLKCFPFARLRYLAATSHGSINLPGGETQHLAPGLNHVHVPVHEAQLEIHVWMGAVGDALKEFQSQFDFVLQIEPGREYSRRLTQTETPRKKPRTVAVVGAGIAGSSVALALCRQGIEVHLHDAADGPAAGASGNWVGAFHPHITRGDSPLSRLSRLGFQHTVAALRALTRAGLLTEGEDWGLPGHLQTLPPEEADRMQETLQQLDFPLELVRWAEPGELLPTPLGGLFFPQAGWVKPWRWVQANLEACGDLLKVHYNSPLTDLAPLEAEHDAVVVCCAQQSLLLAPVPGAQVSMVKGQISKLRSLQQPGLVLSGESYAIAPPAEQWMVVGATYERPVLDLEPTPQADQENIQRFIKAFPDWPLGDLLESRCSIRSVWHDRLPAIGPVPNRPGVFMSTGFASRGLLWAALGAWLVADYCQGQALESRLLGRLAPRAAKQRTGA